MDVQDKLKELRGERGLDGESLALLDAWEGRLEAIRASESFMEHPETGKLRALAEDAVESINEKLRLDEEMGEQERKALFRERRAHVLYLGFLTRDPEAERSSLESEVAAAEEALGG